MRIPPSSFSIFRRSKVLAFFFAVITISCPRGKQVSLSLKNSLMRRLSLFLLTALPVFLLTVSPNLVIPSPFSLRITLKCFVWWRWPDRFRLTKSDGFNILFFLKMRKIPLIYRSDLRKLFMQIIVSVPWPFFVSRHLCHLLFAF